MPESSPSKNCAFANLVRNFPRLTGLSRWLPVTGSATLMTMVIFVSAMNMLALKRATFWRKHTFEVIMAAQTFEENLIDLQRGVRGYVTLGDTNALASYQENALLESQRFNRLVELTRDNPEQQLRLNELSAAMRKVLAYDERIKAIRHKDGPAILLDTGEESEGRILFGNARSIVKAVWQEEQSLLAKRDAAEQVDSNNAERLLIFGCVLAVLLLVLANTMASRELRRRRQIEMKLRESEERFRSAFDDAPIGMALVNPQGRWLKVNHALCQMLGYKEAELLAVDYQKLSHPEDYATDREYIGEMLAKEIASYQLEKRYFHKSGKTISVMQNVSLVCDHAGQPLYFVAQIENVTERRRYEEERDHMIAELQGVIAQVKTLSGMIPICGWCKNIRSDEGYWQSVEQYVRAHSVATFSHGMCPSCAEKFKADVLKKNFIAPELERTERDTA